MVAAVPGVVTRNPNAVEKHVRRRPIEHVATRRTLRPPTEIKTSPRIFLISIFLFRKKEKSKKYEKNV